MSKIRYYSVENNQNALNSNKLIPSLFFANSPLFDFNKTSITTLDSSERRIWELLQSEISCLPDDSPYFIFSAPGALITDDFDSTKFLRHLEIASSFETEILLGGAGWFSAAVEVRDSFFWIEHFRGAHFLVIFRNIYEKILETSFVDGDALDLKLSYLTERKFLIFPFVACQQEDALIEGEFHMHQGYADSTAPVKVAVSSYAASRGRLAVLSKVRHFFFDN